jgi:hypothetical protein
MKYRSKTIEIEANQFLGEMVVGVRSREDGTCYVVTIHGQETEVAPGDWIILENPPGDGTRAYPCKPDVFERRYERLLSAPENPAEPTVTADLQDAAIFIRRLSHALQPSHPVVIKSRDWLRRRGLIGSPLRGEIE